MTKDDIRLLFEYDRWANNRILRAASALTPEQFTRDLGGSFCSVRDPIRTHFPTSMPCSESGEKWTRNKPSHYKQTFMYFYWRRPAAQRLQSEAGIERIVDYSEADHYRSPVCLYLRQSGVVSLAVFRQALTQEVRTPILGSFKKSEAVQLTAKCPRFGRRARFQRWAGRSSTCRHQPPHPSQRPCAWPIRPIATTHSCFTLWQPERSGCRA